MKYCKRPFSSVEEMDEAMIERHNKIVKPSDIVYWLGDFAFHKSDEEISKLIRRHNGEKIIITGNHDRRSFHSMASESYYRILELSAKIFDPGLTLCHYPMMSWNKSFHGAFHLHGHTHGMIPFDGVNRRLDAGVDVHNFTPISWEEVRDKLSKLPTPKELMNSGDTGIS